MARTSRDVVDYFPHDAHASEGDTLTVLESRYGLAGYAFWFKLLERLASTDGHTLDLSNPLKWQLFVAKMGTPEITTLEMLNLLVEMQAIDKDLWLSKLIWCQKLVNNIADVYTNRRRQTPQKPITTTTNSITTDDNPISTPKPLVEIPQSKVKETKGNNSKGNDNSILPDGVDAGLWFDFLEIRKQKRIIPTDRALKLLLGTLTKLREAGEDPNAVLEQSIMCGWTGLFPMRKTGNGDKQGGKRDYKNQKFAHLVQDGLDRNPELLKGH